MSEPLNEGEPRERLGTPISERPQSQAKSSNRVNLKMRVSRELALWALFAQDANRDLAQSPFAMTRFQIDMWRADREMWRLHFSSVKPKERVINLWKGEAIWRQSYEMIEGVLRYKGAIDALISRSSHHWQLHRMGDIDRNLLRIATYELCFEPSIPARAVLNEAIELGKRYGSADSGRFINGVLDRVAQELGRVESRGGRVKAPEVEVVSRRGAAKQGEER